MKNILFSHRGLFFVSIFAISACLQNACSKDEVTREQVNRTDATLQTRGNKGDKITNDWECSYCHTINWEWRATCIVCGKGHDTNHSTLIINLWRIVQKGVTEIEGLEEEKDLRNRVELPNGKFPAYAPEPWYDTSGPLAQIDKLRKSSNYKLVKGYAEDAEYAWYHTTRILYPGLHNTTEVERIYTRFTLNEGRGMSQGMKDGSKAAIYAFVNCR